MKRMIISLIICSLSGYLSAQDTKTVKLEDELLFGNIKKLVNKTYIQKSLADTLVLESEFIFSFNEMGLISMRQGMSQFSNYKYDKSSKLQELIVSGENEELYRTNKYFYDSNGLLVRHLSLFPPSTPKVQFNFEYSETVYAYNNDGKLIERKSFNKRIKSKFPNLKEYIRYQYDTNGDCILQQDYANDSILQSVLFKTYRDHKLIETFSWSNFEDENLYEKEFFSYNNDSTLQLHQKILFEYNSMEKINVQTDVRYTYKYESNHLIEKTITSYKTTSIKYFDFDVNGNWHKMTINDNGKLKTVFREFDYY